ncbi:MAG: S8 family serine peptidase [Deltaproteobacteria bacterium]|nr:S8 family serine peptidase [Deltaproteobacteria bacterium]
MESSLADVPMVVNISVGAHEGAHDGTDPAELAIDRFTNSAANRIVVVGAGNDGCHKLHAEAALPASSGGQPGTIDFLLRARKDDTESRVAAFFLPQTPQVTCSCSRRAGHPRERGAAPDQHELEGGDDVASRARPDDARRPRTYVAHGAALAEPQRDYFVRFLEQLSRFGSDRLKLAIAEHRPARVHDQLRSRAR